MNKLQGINNRFVWEDLDRFFTAPNTISPFYCDGIKIPRKLKKKVKLFCWVHWDGLTNRQRLWHYLEKNHNSYKRFLIKKVCMAKK